MQSKALFCDIFQISGMGAIEVSIFDTFAPLEADWRALEEHNTSTVYQRYDWVYQWAYHVSTQKNIKPRLVIAKKDGKPLFILPLCLFKVGLFTALGWLADSHSNFQTGLFANCFKEQEDETHMPLVFDWVARTLGGIDILVLCCQPKEWLGIKHLSGSKGHVESANAAYFLNLEGGFQTALSRRSVSSYKRKRKKHRWQLNKLKDAEGPHLRRATTPQEVKSFLDVGFKQMATRFKKIGIENPFQKPGVKEFLQNLALISLDQKRPALQLYGLEIDGKLRATLAGGFQQTHFSACFLSIEEGEFSHITPGELMLYLVIEECAQQGALSFDLGRGDERYKHSWCDETILMVETIIPLRKRAFVFAYYCYAKSFLKKIIRNNKTLWPLAKYIRKRVKTFRIFIGLQSA